LLQVVANVEDVDDGDDAVDADDEAQHKSCFNWSEPECRCSTERLGHKIKQHFSYCLYLYCTYK